MTPGAALLVALFSQVAAGATPEATPTRLRVDVQAPSACTSRSDLAARIAARSPRIQVVEDAPLAAHVVITSPRLGVMIAEIAVGTAGADQAPRRVTASSCAEVADGAALIIAVTLDPSLRRRSSPGRTETRGTAGDAATPPAPTPAPTAAPTARPAPAPPPPSSATVTTEPQTAPVAARPSRRELSATLGGQTISGAAPAVLPGVAVYVMAGLAREGMWAPAIFVGATHVWRTDLAEDGAAASFTMDALSIDACPLALRWSRLALRPCASALIGRLASHGENTQPATGATRPFGTAGAALTATWGSRWQLLARLGLGATLIRDSYQFVAVFYQAAPVTFSATVGAGVSWP
jgi:hypothetical protein